MNRKPFYLSKTFWGLAVTAVGAFAPKYAQPLQGVVQDVITTVGLATALYGRWTATRALAVGSPPERNGMGRLSLLILALPLLIVQASAQEAPDAVKLSAAFSNSEFGNILSTQYRQGLTAELDARVFRYERFRLGGVFQYNRADLGSSAGPDTYSFGPQLSGDLFKGYVSPFGRALFGFRTTYNQDRRFSRTYGFGLDINLGHVFLRPIALDYQKVEGCVGTVQRYSAGAGVRF